MLLYLQITFKLENTKALQETIGNG